MRIVGTGVQRIVDAGGSPRAEAPSAERIAFGQKRSAALSLIVGDGCGFCCGKQHLTEGGSILLCSVQEDPESTPQELTASKQCGIPALYSQVFANERQDLTFAEVRELVPLLETPAEPAASPAPSGPALGAPATPPSPPAPATQANNAPSDPAADNPATPAAPT